MIKKYRKSMKGVARGEASKGVHFTKGVRKDLSVEMTCKLSLKR